MQGFISGLTYVGRKSHLLLFINGRPVECGQLKRSIEAQYLAHNPKASKPWLFMVSTMYRLLPSNAHCMDKHCTSATCSSCLQSGSRQLIRHSLQDLRLPSRHVEVNMHPTKKEVGFLHQVRVRPWRYR